MSWIPKYGRLIRRSDVSRVEETTTARKPKRHQLDHDGDGKPGGSLPKAERKPKNPKPE